MDAAEGAELNYSTYHNKTLQRTYQQEAELLDYRTYLGIVGWGFFVGADYASADKRLTVSMGVRADGCDYSTEMDVSGSSFRPVCRLPMP